MRKVQRWKQVLLVTVQIILAFGVLAWLFRGHARRQEVENALHHAQPGWLLAGLASYAAVEVLGGMRWCLLLRIQELRLSLRRAVSIFLISLFFTTFTPGLIGGDAARVFYVIQEEPERKGEALLVVAMDRLMGLISLILLAAVVVVLRHAWLAATAASGWLEWVTLVILGAGAAMLALGALAARLPALGILERHPSIREKLAEIKQAVTAYRQHWPETLQALANTLVAHLFYFLTFYCAARALGTLGPPESMGRGLWDMFCVMPIVNTLTALPISFAGIGIRESLFEVLLRDLCGIAAGVGASIGSLGFAMRAFWSLPGGVILLYYRASMRRPRGAASPAEITASSR